MKRTSLILAAALAAVVAGPAELFAATAAYWRHEEGPAGSIVPDGPDTVLDSSGNGNHMQTYSSAFAPFTAATYTTEVSPLALRSGQPNTLALDFGPSPAMGTEDGADPSNGNGRNDDNFTGMDKPIEEQLFTALTVELAFNFNAIDGYQALFGKDGKPLGDDMPNPGEFDSPVPPLKIMVRGDDFPDGVPNQLFVEWIDGDGFAQEDIHFLAGGETIVPDTWYHVAFTLDASNAELWVAQETGPYVLKDAISGGDFAGPANEVLVADPTPLSIGRGMFGNGVTDWADAIIDEVRVSDEVLTPEEFLFVTAAGDDVDFDDDGDVDGNDFLIIQRGLGTTHTAADLANWQAQFGTTTIQAVPEPATVALASAALAAAALAARRRRN
jgi:hypothetical protein